MASTRKAIMEKKIKKHKRIAIVGHAADKFTDDTEKYAKKEIETVIIELQELGFVRLRGDDGG